MLVISRKKGESLLIDRAITITILRGFGGETRLGIEAPKHIEVMRTELLEDHQFRTSSNALRQQERRERAVREKGHLPGWVDTDTTEDN